MFCSSYSQRKVVLNEMEWYFFEYQCFLNFQYIFWHKSMTFVYAFRNVPIKWIQTIVNTKWFWTGRKMNARITNEFSTITRRNLFNHTIGHFRFSGLEDMNSPRLQPGVMESPSWSGFSPALNFKPGLKPKSEDFPITPGWSLGLFMSSEQNVQ